ncbi:hypothetical protein M9H77_36972 [Catharanthus roseus]|uniref:Uncharacterized protein n=1 Tax=Catharanthus roseus TaxID=4058 RepID=A0ACB9ZVH4_CATRO|nr:hypothetical protein M9H77_36972 [Catharanthus roseus]
MPTAASSMFYMMMYIMSKDVKFFPHPNRGAGNASEVALDQLPTEATCTNLLKLPPYRSKEQMEQKLLYAINAATGFDLSCHFNFHLLPTMHTRRILLQQPNDTCREKLQHK